MVQEVLKDILGIDYSVVPSIELENIIYVRLLKLGVVHRQYRVNDRGDGRRGKIDFVVDTGSELIPIEVDRITPRAKSIFKVKSVNPTHAFVLTKTPLALHSF